MISLGFMQINISAALLILVVLLFRTFTVNRLPKFINLVLWSVVLLRLWFPFFIPMPVGSSVKVGLAQTAQTLQGIIQASIPVIRITRASRGLPFVIIILWLTGAATFLLLFFLLFLYHLMRLADAIPVQENEFLNGWLVKQHLHRKIKILHSDRIQTPITYGIFRPRILLPARMDLSDTETLLFVLQHELFHIKRMDILWKILVDCTVCLYWFNPAVWVYMCCVNRDLEISCDEHVLKKEGFQARERYASALVRMAEADAKMEPVSQGFSHNALEERVVAVMYYKKTSVWAVVLGFVLTAASISVFAAAPKVMDFPISYIPQFCNSGAILTVGNDGKLIVENPGLTSNRNAISSSQTSSADTLMPAGNSSTSSTSSIVQPSGKPDTGTHMPNRKPGMRFVYDGGKNLIKITNADSSLYYFPGDVDTPEEYQGNTWFLIDPAVNPSQSGVAFNIDSADGMQNAKAWIAKHISKDKQNEIINSLKAQEGTKCTIYYEWLTA